MKKLLLLLVTMLLVQSLRAQPANDFTNQAFLNQLDHGFAPLYVYTNGPGKIYAFAIHNGQLYPVQAGELLPAGINVILAAVPDPGCKFANWSRLNIFVYDEITLDASGQENPPIWDTIISPVAYPQPFDDWLMEGTVPGVSLLA